MSVPNPIDSMATPLALDQIQGNILAGFNKDHQRFLFLGVTDTALAKKWLQALIPQISTTEQVKEFNDEFRKRRLILGVDPPVSELKATWTNIAFTATGLAALGVTTTGMAPEFLDGMAARKQVIGDLGPSDPASWQFAFRDPQKLHILLIVAADDCSDLTAQVNTLLGELPEGGLSLLLDQSGENLTGNMAGFEHFGFKDGISQPGVKTFTISANDQPAPDKGHQGVPGQDLLWPGEFVIGYSTQVGTTLDGFDGPNPAEGRKSSAGQDGIETPGFPPAPAWTHDGSFLVFRKLAQDVGAFRANMKTMAAAQGVPDEVLGAKLVGRYSSGCPMQPTSHEVVVGDLPKLTPVEKSGFPPTFDPNQGDPADLHRELLHPNLINAFEYSNDPAGNWVARSGHVRKAYPRDEVIPGKEKEFNESFVQTKRMLRRGIPYGPQVPLLGPLHYLTPKADEPPCLDDSTRFQPPVSTFPTERGLLFLAYQKSIALQFEFVQQNWINDANFPQLGDGLDPIMSQTPNGAVTCPINGHSAKFDVKHFVTTSGGEYFFQPSIDALTMFSAST